MQRHFCLILIILGVIAFLFTAGCTGTHGIPGTSAPTAVPSPAQQVTPAITFSATPGPTQTVPDYESISVTVQRNTITENPTITATYNGGLGLGMTERMDMTVIRSDGITESDYLDNPTMGAAITLMGTTGTDRDIVAVTMTSGDQYTIIDRYYPFPGSGSTG